MSSTATKKTTTKKAKAKKPATSSVAGGIAAPPVGSHTHALIAAALKRATAQVESLDGGKDALPEGGYPVALTIDIAGDVVVGAAKEGTTANDFSDKDLLGAVMSLMKPEEIDAWIDEAVAQLKKAAKDQTLATMLKSTAKTIADAADRAAKKRRLRKDKAGARGAVSGKPTVSVSGTVDIGVVQITVGGEAAPDSDNTGERDAA